MLEDVVWADPLLQERLPFRFKRPGGASAHALAAEDAGSVHHTGVHERANGGVVTPAVKAEGKGILRIFGAHLHTAPAVDALVVITQVKGVVVVNGGLARFGVGETAGVCAVLGDERQDFRRFGQVYGGGQHFQESTPSTLHRFAVGVDDHALGAGGNTGGRLHPPAGVYGANAAQAIGGEMRVVADDGDVDAQHFGRVQDGGFRGDGDGLVVNSKGDGMVHIIFTNLGKRPFPPIALSHIETQGRNRRH